MRLEDQFSLLVPLHRHSSSYMVMNTREFQAISATLGMNLGRTAITNQHILHYTGTSMLSAFPRIGDNSRLHMQFVFCA